MSSTGPGNCAGAFCFFHYSAGKESTIKGTVKFFIEAKGYGFITAENGEDIFFQRSNIKNTGFRSVLRKGDLVTFDTQNGQKGKRAVNIFRI